MLKLIENNIDTLTLEELFILQQTVGYAIENKINKKDMKK